MSDITNISKKLGMYDNVCLRVVDIKTKKIVQEYVGHNAATSTILTGIVHFLAGDGILNQAKFTLKDFIPQYMSLGTMGLCSQMSNERGLPIGIGNITNPVTNAQKAEAVRDYMKHLPGFGADGYSSAYNNGREYFGLGEPIKYFYGDVNRDEEIDALDASYITSYLHGNPPEDFDLKLADYNRDGVVDNQDVVDMQLDIADENIKHNSLPGELISMSFPRVPITYRSIIPETDTEAPKSMDLILGGLVSSNALESFMKDQDYIFVTEAGLWNNRYSNGNDTNKLNGMLAGYRIFPQSINLIDIDSESDERVAEEYENIQKSILRVNRDQVVQIIWKIQLGSIEDIDIVRHNYYYDGPYWNVDPITTVPVEELL